MPKKDPKKSRETLPLSDDAINLIKSMFRSDEVINFHVLVHDHVHVHVHVHAPVHGHVQVRACFCVRVRVGEIVICPFVDEETN
jgi:hypothetical protein